MLDDAMIHLRYADNLWRFHFITYNGIHANYGASSLLYVSLLALLHPVAGSYPLPKVVSLVTYVLLVSLVCFGIFRLLANSLPQVKITAIALLLVVISPSSIRWLSDGMETVIVVLLAFIFGGIAVRECEGSSDSMAKYLAWAAFGFLATLLRVELSLMIAFGSLAIWASKISSTSHRQRPLQAALTTSHFSLGSVVAMLVIIWKMHHLLPDTAVAKASGDGHAFNVLLGTLDVMVGAFSAGIGLFLVWVLSAWQKFQSLRSERSSLLAWLCANAPFPILIFMAALRGQAVQGVRYVMWTMIFSSCWNLLSSRTASTTGPTKTNSQTTRWIAIFPIMLILLAWPFESYAMHHVMKGRANTYQLMQSSHLDVLRGEPGVAQDIGFIGYFSQADICDLAGLVNGRVVAKMDPERRRQRCAALHPDFMFLTSSQAHGMLSALDFSHWIVCRHYDFTNVRGLDRHYLIVPPEAAPKVCKAAGEMDGQASTVIPELHP
ncbi:MAG: hypothetical protein ACYC46_05295 [Acidobacteriaceae bacterium]